MYYLKSLLNTCGIISGVYSVYNYYLIKKEIDIITEIENRIKENYAKMEEMNNLINSLYKQIEEKSIIIVDN
jgi:hypothetical protein